MEPTTIEKLRKSLEVFTFRLKYNNTLCDDMMPEDTKYWACNCRDYDGDHAHTLSSSRAFPVSRVNLTEEEYDQMIETYNTNN